MSEILKIIVLSMVAALGFNATDSALVSSVIEAFAAVDIRVQGAIVAVILVTSLVPLIAPYTPWTWDDKTLEWAPVAQKIFGEVWNALSGNHGKAKNKESEYS